MRVSGFRIGKREEGALGRGEKYVFWVGLAALLTVLGGRAAGQEVVSRLDKLVAAGSLQIGQEVYVSDTNGNRTRGTLEELTSRGVRVTVASGTRSWIEGDLVRIERRDAVTNGAWIGVVIGMSLFVMQCRYDSGICPPVPYGLIPFGVGAVVGAGFDTLITRTVYIAEPGVRVHTLPLMASGDRAGVGVAITW